MSGNSGPTGIVAKAKAALTKHTKNIPDMVGNSELRGIVAKAKAGLEQSNNDSPDMSGNFKSTGAVAKAKAGLEKHSKDVPESFGKFQDRRDEIRKQMDKNTPKQGAVPSERTNWTAAETVRKTQGGVLGKGIYLTKDLDERLKERQTIIEVKDDIEFRGPMSAGEICTQEFSSQKMMETFQRNTDKSSSPKEISAGPNFYFVSLEGSYSAGKMKDYEEETSALKEETFMATIHCEKIAVKSVELTKHQVTLTSHAIKKLKKIEQSLKETNYESKGHFTSFFKAYGSHAAHGVIDFGGIRMSTATHRSNISNITSKASEKLLSAGFRWKIFGAKVAGTSTASDVKGMTTEKYETNDLQKTKVSMKMIGGPPGVYDQETWRRELVENSSLWTVINRESEPIPIWELLENHEDEFENCSLLSDAMEEEWNAQEKQDTYRVLDKLRTKIDLCLEKYKDEQNLSACVKKLAAIRKEHQVSIEDWQEQVPYRKDVQDKLLEAAEFITKVSSGFVLKGPLSTILSPLDKIEVRRFPKIREIIGLITSQGEESPDLSSFQITAIAELPEFLRTRIANADEQKVKVTVSRLQATVKEWKNKNFSYEDLICLAVLPYFGFNFKHCSFEYLLRKNVVQEMIGEMEKNLHEIRQFTQERKKQAKILSLALTSKTERPQAVQYMIDSMPNLHQGIAESFRASKLQGSEGMNYNKFKDKLSDILVNSSSDGNLQDLAHSIKQRFANIVQPGRCKSSELSKEIKMSSNGVVNDLLNKLGLTQYYPQKITYECITTLTPADLEKTAKKPERLSELPWYFIRQIIGLDSTARESVNVNVRNQSTPSLVKTQQYGDRTSAGPKSTKPPPKWNPNYKAKVLNVADTRNKDPVEAVHPLDLICAVFLCADDFLRQELVDKMSKCQYAIPLLLPTPSDKPGDPQNLILQWALKAMIREFKIQGRTMHKTMIDFKCPVVSFLSLGDEIKTLEVLNEMVNPDCFWHKKLPGAGCQQTISRGMAEIAWYLPGGHINDKFAQAVGFVNVRGNALDRDRKLISSGFIKSSSLSVVCIDKVDEETYNYLAEHHENLDKIILLVLYKPENAESVKIGLEQVKEHLSVRDENLIVYENVEENFHTIVTHLKQSIERQAEASKTCLSKVVSEIQKTCNVNVDTVLCQQGDKAAQSILNDLDEYNKGNSGNAKAAVLPCQSDIWSRQEMAKHEKEQYRQKNKKETDGVIKHTENVKREKWNLQYKQLLGGTSKTFMNFLQHVVELDKKSRKYFLTSLKLGLNERSANVLAPLIEAYNQCRLDMDGSQDKTGRKAQELDYLSQKLTHAAVGLEHFFRELAVMYENMYELNKRTEGRLLNDVLDTLSSLMADIWLEGTAMEVFDGDAIHAPVLWLEAVLEKVENSARCRIFRVSVLGAQSCGKSTVFNTTFGLHFAVSSGRCTRGAYMQLVKIGEDLSKTLSCDYLLIIDSEGLMARTREDESDFDNELATFVIGLSDLTLVMIKGEGNEMKDVLPIAVHAFMRMNKIGVQQACRFVHRTVGAVDTEQAAQLEVDAFVKQLDKSILAAAKDTELSHRFSRFTDVLHYDNARDNTFVANLWERNPPMGKADVVFCATMQELKSEVLKRVQVVTGEKRIPLKTLLEFRRWLKGIWEAIKYENFVFSFKNVLAIEAHRELTKIYEEKRWKIKEIIWDTVKDESGKIEMKVQDLPDQESVETCLKSMTEAALNVVRKVMAAEVEELKNDVMKCFPCEHDLREEGKDCCKARKIPNLQLEEKNEFERYIKQFHDTINEESREQMKELRGRLQAESKIKWLKDGTDMYEILNNRVTKLIQQQKGKDISDDELENVFNDMWRNVTGDIIRAVRQTEEQVNIENKIQGIILNVLNAKALQGLYIQKINEKNMTHRRQSVEFREQENHIEIKPFSEVEGLVQVFSKAYRQVASGFQEGIDPRDIYKIRREREMVVRSAEKYYRFVPGGKKFDPEDVQRLFQGVCGKIEEIKRKKVKVTPEFMVDLVMHIEEAAVRDYKKLHEAYQRESSPYARLEKVKIGYLDRFRTAMGQGREVARLCKNALKGIVTYNIEHRLDRFALFKYLRSHSKDDSFKDVKNLQGAILIDMYKAKKNQFELYDLYINQYESLMKAQMTSKSVACFKENNCLQSELAEPELDDIIDNVINGAVDKLVGDTSPDSQFVKNLFDELTKSKLVYDRMKSEQYFHIQVEDKKEFGNKLMTYLQGSVKPKILTEIKEWCVEDKLQEKDLINYAFEQVIGCSERCPFCGAPCDNCSGGKIAPPHSVTLHRPGGLGAWRYEKNKKLVLEDCRVNVASNSNFYTSADEKTRKLVKFKRYFDIYPDWKIDGDSNPDAEKYWKWVFAKYNEEFAKQYKAQPADIPDDWKKYSKDDIEEDIRKHYNYDVGW